MTGKLALMLTVAALLVLCGCSSYEVTSSSDPAPLPPVDGLFLDVEVSYGPDNIEPETSITFVIPKPGWVRLEILNATGHRVRLLLDEELPGTSYSVSWDARNDDGELIESGIYMYRLEASGDVYSRVAYFCMTEEGCDEISGGD